MSTSRLQEQRYELKYLIDEATAARVRPFVQSYLRIDEFSYGQPNLSYPVHSLYLDSGGLKTYWDTINGNKNRYKLRLRYYSEDMGSPIFFEVKRRLNEVILKHRAGVQRAAVPHLLAGQFPRWSDLLVNNGEEMVALQNFIELMITHQATPKIHVFYMREAYENPNDNSVRVTMDRTVLSAPNHTKRLIVKSDDPYLVFGNQVILELKFTTRFPNWFRDLVETFHCMQGGAAKYAEGIFVKGEDWAIRKRSSKSVGRIVHGLMNPAGTPQVDE